MIQESQQALFQAYRQYRQKNPTMKASEAYHYTKADRQGQKHPPLSWERPERSSETIKFAKLDVEGFQCHVCVKYDYDHDSTRDRGTFTSQWEEGAIVVPGSQHDRNIYRYFVPENTEESHRSWFEQQGYSRSQAAEMAHEYVLQDMKMAASLEDAGYIAVFVEANISFRGVYLGGEICGGIEVESADHPYIEEVAWEQIHSALSDAKKQLEVLRQP